MSCSCLPALSGSASCRPSLDIFPKAAEAALAYFQLQSPPAGEPYNALQQLAYFGVVFVLSPLQIATGLAMSPAVAGRFPWFPKLFGGCQAARSLHFLGLIAFIGFTVQHTALVIADGLTKGLSRIVLGISGEADAGGGSGRGRDRHPGAGGDRGRSHLGHARVSRRPSRHAEPPAAPRRPATATPAAEPRVSSGLSARPPSRQVPRPNGRPPHDPDWQILASDNFRAFTFEVSGLVEQPLSLTLDDLRTLPAVSQTTKHVCIQGWSQVVSWKGLSLAVLLERARPLPDARYLLFRTFDDKWEHPGEHGYFYGAIDLELARHPQSILAYDMNGQPLSAPFGAPLRLRVESQLGYKMVKWVRSVELIADYRDVGAGKGGWREDVLHYSQIAPI